MKYEVIRDCIIKGSRHKVGDVVSDLTDQLAKDLMAIGRLAPHHEEPKKGNRAVALEDSEEKPKRRGRPPKAKPEDE
jgi:hypothetical protein